MGSGPQHGDDYALRSLARPDAGAEGTVRALFAAFAARDVEAAIATAHPAIELWAQPTAERAGRTGPYRGHDGLRTYFADVERVWETFTVAPSDWRVVGTGVVCFGSAEGRARDGTSPSAGSMFWVFKLQDELIVSCRAVRTAAHATALAGG